MTVKLNFGQVPDNEKEKYKALLKVVGGLIGAPTPTQNDDVELITKALASSFQDDIQNRLSIDDDAIINSNLSDIQCYGALYIAVTGLVTASSILSQSTLRTLLKKALADLDKIEQFGDLLFLSLGNSLQRHKAKETALH